MIFVHIVKWSSKYVWLTSIMTHSYKLFFLWWELLRLTPLATFKGVKHCFTRVTMLYVTSPGLICSWKFVPFDHCWCVILILPTPLLSLAPCGFLCIRIRKKLSTWFWCLGEKKLIRSLLQNIILRNDKCLQRNATNPIKPLYSVSKLSGCYQKYLWK